MLRSWLLKKLTRLVGCSGSKSKPWSKTVPDRVDRRDGNGPDALRKEITAFPRGTRDDRVALFRQIDGDQNVLIGHGFFSLRTGRLWLAFRLHMGKYPFV